MLQKLNKLEKMVRWLYCKVKNTAIGGIQSIVAGDNITVDNSDPANPVVSSTGGGSGGGVITEDSDTVAFTGNGTAGNPLSAESVGGGNNLVLIKGNATQANAPTPYTAEDFPNGLFETYVVRTPLTMPNSWGSAVTQAELDANNVYFNVKNGVITKSLSFKNNEIADGYITPEKTDFFTPKNANLADTSKIKSGFSVDETNGNLFSTATYQSYLKIPIESSKSYYWNILTRFAWYDENGIFISGGVDDGLNKFKTSPLNAKFVSFSVYSGSVTMFAQSDVFIDYIPFELAIESKYLPGFKTSDIEDGSITTDKVAFYKGSYSNLNQFVFDAGNWTATGISNFGQGIGTLIAITTAVGNYASGIRAMNKLTSGNGNVAVGVDALREAQTVIDCSFLGWEAGRDQISGVGDSGFGRRTLAMAEISGNNTGFGDSNLYRVLPNSTTFVGFGNTSAGYVAMEFGFKNTNSVGIGRSVGRFVNSYNSVVIGESAYYGEPMPFADTENKTIDVTTVGKRNVIIGQNALGSAKSVDDVVAIGQASFINLKANRNIGIGTSVGNGIVNGTQNILFGYGVQNTGDYSNCIVAGYNQNATANNQIIIGNSTHESVEICGVKFTKAQLIALKALI